MMATQELSKHEQATMNAQLIPEAARTRLNNFWQANKAHIVSVIAGEDTKAVAAATYSALYRTPKLISCTPFSLLNGIVLAHQMGLRLGTQEVSLVPFGNEATLIVGYQGKVKLALASKLIKAIHADCVMIGEPFTYKVTGSGVRFSHEPKWEGRQRATETNIVGAYCQLQTKVGGTMTRFVPLTEILDARERSRGYKYQKSKGQTDNPWFTDFGTMAMKTAVHRVMKLAPQDARLAMATAIDDEEMGGNAVVADGLDPSCFSMKELQEPLVEVGRDAARDVATQKLIDMAPTVDKLGDPVPLTAGAVRRYKDKLWRVEDSENGHQWIEMMQAPS